MALNPVQLFGIILLGGLCSGELSRRLMAVPRTTGYVLFGLFIGQSGLGLISLGHIESAQLFIDLALGLILFELGFMVPRVSSATRWLHLRVGLLLSLFCAFGIVATLTALGFPFKATIFAAALCLATSPAITIATTSDVGAKGPKTELLLSLVAINGSIAFIGVTWANAALSTGHGFFSAEVMAMALQKVFRSIALGAACAALVLLGARRLARQIDQQHLLIVGMIVLGVGVAIALDLSVLFPMLVFGYLTRLLDRENRVLAIRIASDARVFLVITFVLAGAALDITLLRDYWLGAVTIILARFSSHFVAMRFLGDALCITRQTACRAVIGLQPMSSVALVLLSSTQSLYGTLDVDLANMLMATILLLQLVGPLSTQVAILGFVEATHLRRQSTGIVA